VRILLRCTAGELAEATGASGEAGAAAGDGALVMVVDDDEDMRAMLAESLATLGHRVVEAADGPAALAMLRARRPQLVVLDFAMPGMNGAEVAREIWRERPGLPVLFAAAMRRRRRSRRSAGRARASCTSRSGSTCCRRRWRRRFGRRPSVIAFD